MAAITWQNINGPSLAEAARPLSDARDSFKDMFGSFENILKQRQATETANWDQGKLNNTNALLSAVQGAKTPEEYAALEAGLREQMSGYGAQVDATAARSAMDTRLGTLQQRAKQAGEYKDWNTDQAEAPVTREIAAANARQDPLTANLLMEANPNLRTMPALAAAYTASQRQVTDDAQRATTFADGQTKFAQEQLLYPNAVTASNNALLIQEANIAKINAEADKAKNDKLYGSKEDRASQQAAFDKRLAGSLMSGGAWNSVKGRATIGTNMKASELTGDNVQSVYDKVAAKFPNGISFPEIGADGKPTGKTSNKPLPTQLVQQAIDLTDNSYVSYLGGTFGGRVADNLAELIKNPEVRQQLEEGYQAQLDADTGGNNASTAVAGAANPQAIKDALAAVRPPEAPKGRVEMPSALDAAYAKRLAEKKTLK